MSKINLASILVLLLATPVLAQESGTEGQAGQMQQMQGQGGQMGGTVPGNADASTGEAIDLSVLPQGCRDAIDQSAMSGMMQSMDMSGMMEGMSEHQQASMEAMNEMHVPMMAAHTIEDPDLAFNCGMIVHHTGAIGMAEVEIEFGEDEDAKARAQQVIDDQQREIEEMTAWVQEHAGQQ